jgi:hypothetical protein
MSYAKRSVGESINPAVALLDGDFAWSVLTSFDLAAISFSFFAVHSRAHLVIATDFIVLYIPLLY